MPTDPVSEEWSSLRYEENARFVSDLGEPVVRLLNPQPGESVLDLGCGDGVLTKKIASTGAKVVGIDGSADMIAAVRRNGVNATVRDAHRLNFEAEFDAVFSNAALHWVKRDPDLAIDAVYRAIKPGGPLCCRDGRPWQRGRSLRRAFCRLGKLRREGLCRRESLVLSFGE